MRVIPLNLPENGLPMVFSPRRQSGASFSYLHWFSYALGAIVAYSGLKRVAKLFMCSSISASSLFTDNRNLRTVFERAYLHPL